MSNLIFWLVKFFRDLYKNYFVYCVCSHYHSIRYSRVRSV